jgi:hypothetical protein
MKRLALSVAVATLVLTGCGTTSKSTDKISEQKLSTSFVTENIKIETKCSWFGMGSECNIVAVEATGTAPSFGGTSNNRRNALVRAEMRAKASVAEFLNTQVSSNRVQTTFAKNLEKAVDKVNAGKGDDNTAVEMSDVEAKNVSLRENNNNTAITLTETLRTSASAILRGFHKIDEKVVGDQEVAVTIRWDVASNNARKQLIRAMQ